MYYTNVILFWITHPSVTTCILAIAYDASLLELELSKNFTTMYILFSKNLALVYNYTPTIVCRESTVSKARAGLGLAVPFDTTQKK